MNSLKKNNPNSRRHIVASWNVGDLDKMHLLLVMLFFNFTLLIINFPVNSIKEARMFFWASPFNIASYALLTYMIAKTLELELGEFIHTLGDAHLYTNHIEQAKLQLSRSPKKRPTLEIVNKRDDIFSYVFEDFHLKNYDAHDHIKAPVSV